MFTSSPQWSSVGQHFGISVHASSGKKCFVVVFLVLLHFVVFSLASTGEPDSTVPVTLPL